MNTTRRTRLTAAIAQVAEHALATHQVVTPIEVFTGVGWLPAARVEAWRFASAHTAPRTAMSSVTW